MTTTEVKKLIRCETVSKKNGVYKARLGFFYTSGRTSEDFANSIKATIPSATIVGHGTVWKEFKGGASVANQSHWWVEFTI